MPKQLGLNKCLVAFDQDSTLVAVIEMSPSSWMVAGIVPGVERQSLKKLDPDAPALLDLLHRWRSEGLKAGHNIMRIAVAYEAGLDSFWLARWLRAILRAIKMELRKRMQDPIKETGAWIARMLKGHLNYFAVPGNDPSLWCFFNQVRRHWLRSDAAKRRS